MQLVTYASDKNGIRAAIDAGADHLILEHPLLSLRSFQNPHDLPGLNLIEDLVKQARVLSPQIELSFNLDIMIHEQHWPLVKEALSVCQRSSIASVRVQDLGLAYYLQEHYPKIQIHLATETGLKTVEALKSTLSVLKNCQRVILNNEIAYADLQNIRKELDCALELQVHGPLLIQYTHRKLLSAAGDAQAEHRAKWAKMQGKGDKRYTFYENQHGHLMYYWADRCLYKSLDDLKGLDLDAWLIDGRGESQDYLQEALNAYAKPFLENTWQTLKAVARRPLRPGFFKANRTDYQKFFEDKVDQADVLGVVVDVIKGRRVSVHMRDSLEARQGLALISAKGKSHPVQASDAQSIAPNVWSFPWKSAVTPGCVLVQA